jgi:hypothetical protein
MGGTIFRINMEILDLVTYKEYQGIKSTNNDTKIQKIINSVNSYISSYCGREFVTYYDTDKVEYFDASQKEYYPKEFPIVSVTSIEYSGSEDGTYDESLTLYTDYVIDWDASRIVSVNDSFVSGVITPINSGKLTYKGGLAEVPIEIEQAAVLLTEYFMNDDYTPRKSLAGASTDNIIIPDKDAKLPPHIRRILEHHRAV